MMDFNLLTPLKWTFPILLLIIGVTPVSARSNSPDFASIFGFAAPRDSIDVTSFYLPGLSDHRMRTNFTLEKNERDTWSTTQKTSRTHWDPPVTIPGTLQAVPDTLWDIEVGGGFRRRWAERRETGVSLSVGSASDEPFDSHRETTLRLTATATLPSREKNLWLFSMNYSNNRYFANNIPLPGVAYFFHRPLRGFHALIGFPFCAVSYAPVKKWSGRLALFGPTNVSAEISHMPFGPIKIYSGFEWSQASWLRADRELRKNRLFYDQKKWLCGVKMPLIKSIHIDLSSGYSFDRRLFEAKSASEGNISKARLDPAWFAQLKIALLLGTK